MTALSAWAADRAHRALGFTTDPTLRLAIALGSIRSVIRVVDRTVPPMHVDWARVDENWARVDENSVIRSMSYSDLRGGQIRINPVPITDGTLDHGAALDVVTGFALHEASHSQESRDRYEVLFKKVDFYPEGLIKPVQREQPAFEPMRVAAYLWNLAEDVRIESVTSRRRPGFAPYFTSVLDWMWTDLARHDPPVGLASCTTIADRLKIVFLACRYPTRAIGPAMLPDTPQDRAEIAWWEAWQTDYLSGTADTATTIQRGLDHLAEDPDTAATMREMVDAERRERERGEKVRAQLERLIREGVDGAYGFCITENGNVVPLDATTAEKVEQLVREGLIETRPLITASGVSQAPVFVRRPAETAESKRAYVGRPDATVQAIRAALVFRNSAPQHDVKLLKSGTIDDEELYRWGMGDYRVFSERVVEAKPEVFMGLLADISGSMMGDNLQIVQRLAQVLVWAVHDQEGIETGVWAHTADVESRAAQVYRIWAKGDPLSRLGLISSLPHHNNRDGAAIETVVREMADLEQPEKVLIVLADGLPSASGYGGEPAMDHVRAVVRWAETRGIRVLQLAVDPWDIRMDEQVRMFGPENVIPYRDDASLPRQLAHVVSRYI